MTSEKQRSDHPTPNYLASLKWALRYVAERLEHGYGPEDAATETMMGHGAPGEPGYSISRGKIRVPAIRGDIFSFAELAAQLSRPMPGAGAGAVPTQSDMFAEVA